MTKCNWSGKLSVIVADPEQSVYVISPEDTILAKLEWYRLGSEVSERQWRDVLGVKFVPANLTWTICERGRRNSR